MDLRELALAGAHRHPWEVARADFFADMLARRVFDHGLLRVLDVGAGDGFFARRLAGMVGPQTDLVCFDPNYTPAQLSEFAQRSPSNVRFSRELPQGRADMLLLLD